MTSKKSGQLLLTALAPSMTAGWPAARAATAYFFRRKSYFYVVFIGFITHNGGHTTVAETRLFHRSVENYRNT